MCRWLCLIFAVCVALAGQSVAAEQSDDAALSVIRKALDRVRWNEDQEIPARVSNSMTREVQRFGGDGEVEDEDRGEYEVFPIDGIPFQRRVTINGRPLSDEERGWEREREAEFREERQRIAEEGEPEEDPEEDEEEIVFNEELISRFVFTLVGEELWRGRPSYRIRFEPRADDLPIRRRVDYALNKARGQVWIDGETFEAARVEFELMDRVRLWWGALGTISEARGSMDRAPVLGEIWGHIQYETYTDVRMLFRRRRRAELQKWRNYEWFVETSDSGAR